MTQIYEGQLEIDHDRGVIYFHNSETGATLLRIGGLPKIPRDANFIDLAQITHHSYIREGTTTHGEGKR